MTEPAPRRRIAAALFVTATALFLLSPARQVSDSYYSLLLAQRLATDFSLDLAGSFGGELPLDRFSGHRRDGLPYQVRSVGERVYYYYPPGSSLLAAPWMGVASALGLGVVDDQSRYDRIRERRHQRWLAALASALFVAGFFAAADRLLPRRFALLLTGIVAFGSPVWSTASRGYWSQTAALAITGAMLPLLAARERGEAGEPGQQRGGFRLGLLAGAAYVCRPTLSIVFLLVGGDLLLRDRRAALRFGLGALPPLACLALLSLSSWGMVLPPYFQAATLDALRLDRLAGVLLSPSRGLLVFEPALAAALIYAFARWRRLEHRRLFALSALGLGLHTLVVASWPLWWGGHGFGPRLFAETLFFQAWIAIAVAGTLCAAPTGDRIWRRVLVACALAGIALHAAGALSTRSGHWNSNPTDVDADPGRVWAWRDWQALAWLDRSRDRREGDDQGTN